MTPPESSPVLTERQGNTGLIALDNPPVNAASQALRQGMLEALARHQADPEVEVIAIYGAGKAFIAGADIREFGKPPLSPSLPEVCLALEASEKPVIAVLHGPTLGGGLEVAIAAHARVALSGATLGFPEVNLGILPGAGGTQRAPRLIGIPAALDLITSGRHIGTEDALRLGLVDRIVQGPPRQAALAAAAEVSAGTLATRRTSDLDTPPDATALHRSAETLRAQKPHLFSPHKCVEAVAASTGPIDEGLALERSLFLECMDSPQRAGLIHAFFAERAVTKIPESAAPAREVARVGVIGGGTMGSGIATALLMAGLPITLIEQDAAGLSHAGETLAGHLSGAVKRGKLSQSEHDRILSEQLHMTTDLGALDQVDLVIEAVFEDMAVKTALFSALDAVAKPEAILATNTSYLDVNEIAAATGRPGQVIGLHFFSPAHIMRLLEVVVADQTSPDVVATGFALARRLRKVAVRAGVCDGFIGNRILATYRRAADYLMIDGARPQQIDAAMEDFGFAMGPFAVSDLAGLDIGWAARKRRASSRDPAERYVAVADRMCERGWFGRKSGAGYYLYDDGPVRPNPDVDPLIDAERQEAGITPRDFSATDISERILAAMVIEAVAILDDGIALRPIDVDAVMLFGYGFPRHRGGPLHAADAMALRELVQKIEAYAGEDPQFWTVPPLLARLASTGGSFSDLN